MSGPLPILFVDHAPALGGAERSLLLLLAQLDRERWQPHLACAGGPLAAEARALGVAVHVVPLPRLRRSPRFALDWARGVRGLAAVARGVGARLLHANTVRAALYCAPAAALARRPWLWHMRDFWLSEAEPRFHAPDRWGKRLVCASARGVVANSHAVAGHLPCPGVRVLHNGIEVERFVPGEGGAAFRAAHAIPAATPLVGMVGRLRPWKGQARFLRLAARVHAERPETRFVLVGGDPFEVGDGYAAALRALATELELGGSVTFTGQLADVRPALAAMDLFVHPGEPEPFGLVNVEAMAMGVPVVALAHGALPEIVTHGESGWLVPPGDPQRLPAAVVALLDDPARLAAMGQAARARAIQHFDIARVVAELDALYQNVVDSQEQVRG